MSGMTSQILRAWVDSVLKPMLKGAVRDGIPLDTFGGALIGYGVSACKGHGMTDDEIRQVVDAALDEHKPT